MNLSICFFELFSKENLQLKTLSEPLRIKGFIRNKKKKSEINYIKVCTSRRQTDTQYFMKAPLLRKVLSAEN